MGRGGSAGGGNFPMTSLPKTSMNPPAYMGGSPSTKSQFVKQELRDVVSRRMPQQSAQQAGSGGGIVQTMTDQMGAPNFDTDELPMDIIESSKIFVAFCRGKFNREHLETPPLKDVFFTSQISDAFS